MKPNLEINVKDKFKESSTGDILTVSRININNFVVEIIRDSKQFSKIVLEDISLDQLKHNLRIGTIERI